MINRTERTYRAQVAVTTDATRIDVASESVT